jgi:betaine-aldehyde dehydrogenase
MAISRALYIGGAWRESEGWATIPCIDPANEQVFGSVPDATAGDVDLAVRAAHAAFRDWSRSTGAERAGFLRRFAEVLTARREEIAALETQDNGKPLAEALHDVDYAARIFAMYADLAADLDTADETLPTSADYLAVRVERRPVGVVALITPWNFPLEQFTWKVAAALAAGCTCVIKPSETTSVTALLCGEICSAIGLPPGVLNIVTGYGVRAGAALVAHPRVAKISFTGSTTTGRGIMTQAAADLKRVGLELGGKSPIIIFPDVDLDRAVEWTMFGAFVNQGQVCTATSRLLLSEEIAPAFLDRLKQRAEALRVGPGTLPDVQMGPLASQAQYNKVMGYIAAGTAEGARLLTGGGRPANLNQGYFVAPTVFTEVTPNMRIWLEEIFGPVLSTMTFATEAEAIALANDSEYGLAAAVLSADADRVARVSDALEAGIIWENCSQIVVMEAPWGGVKKSGMGRELGRWGMESFQELRQVTRWLPDAALGWYPV